MQPLTTMERIELLKLIVDRCKQEGRDAKAAGQPVSACPYTRDMEPERAGWRAGWSEPVS